MNYELRVKDLCEFLSHSSLTYSKNCEDLTILHLGVGKTALEFTSTEAAKH